ncbi:hypothetical protein GCM10010177_16480 [Actinomadura citrea]|nr:hypothetical protein GCM10010177_16480 [Actinomadura citrea]
MHIRPWGQSAQERRAAGDAVFGALGVLAEAMDGAWTSAVPAARTRTAGVVRIDGICDLPPMLSSYRVDYFP